MNNVNPVRLLNDPRFSKNPFNPKEDTKCEILMHDRDIARRYIEGNINNWKFPIDKLKHINKEEAKICFYITYKNSWGSLLSGINVKEKIICKDGFVKEVDRSNIVDEAFLLSKDDVIKLIDILNNFINQKILENKICIVEEISPFSFELLRGFVQPTHLFTRTEIKKEMQMADNRHGNVLVIDADGWAHVIPDNEDALYYPVRLESWDARNNYVGKYSSLEELNSTYLCAIDGWLRYLRLGRQIYSDYTNLNDDEAIIEIKKYY